MTHTNPDRSPRIELLEGRLLLAGQPADISLHVPAKMYEGKAVIIPTDQPADVPKEIRFWDIDWGDGTLITRLRGNLPLKHVYPLFGQYPVQVTGKRRNGEVVNFDFVANVQNIKPAPKITALAAAVPNQPVTFQFKPGDSAPADTLLVTWSIAGQISLPYTPASVSETQSIGYTFTKPGDYRINLAIRDSGGLIGRTTRIIHIAPVVEQPDTTNPTLTNIVAGGTDGNDTITFQDRLSAVEVFINGHSYGVISGANKLLAFGGAGNDLIACDTNISNDVVLDGGAGNDTLVGGGGNNTVSYAQRTNPVTVDLSKGTGGEAGEKDSLIGIENIIGGSGNDLLTGDSKDNIINGGPGNDTLIGGLGNDTLIGGGGSDTASYADRTNPVTVDLSKGIGGEAGEQDSLSGIANIIGGSGNDSLIGDRYDNSISGGPGDDTIFGGAGNDILLGGTGNDSIQGNAGRDILIGGTGADTLNGGIADDILLSDSSSFENNWAALALLQKEWTRTDATYAQRVAHITGTPGGLNKSIFLKAPQIAKDGFSDLLIGNDGQDLFLMTASGTGALDKAVDRAVNEVLVDLGP